MKFTKKKIKGTLDRLRLVVFRSNKNIYAQIIDDVKGETVVSASSLSYESSQNVEAAQKVGETIAKEALKKDVLKVVFDRGGKEYKGRIAALAESARKNGLEF